MAKLFQPSVGYWKDVRRHDKQIFDAAEPMTPHIRVIPESRMLWHGAEEGTGVHWRGAYWSGRMAIVSQIAIAKQATELGDVGYDPNVVRGTIIQYAPMIGRMTVRPSVIEIGSPVDQDVWDAALQEQNKSGIIIPTGADYDLLLHELERGASGEYRLPLAFGE